MFRNLACVFVGPNEFLSYNNRVAGLFSDFRATANAAIDREEGRKLTDKEIEKLLHYVEVMDQEVEDRPPTAEENRLIDEIQQLYPEVRYIVKSLYVTAARGRKRQRKKETKKEQERVRKQDREDYERGDEEAERAQEEKRQRITDKAKKQAQRPEFQKKKKVSDREKQIRREEVEKKRAAREGQEGYEDPDKFGPKKMEPEERGEIYKQLKEADKGEKEYEGWKGMLMNVFDFISNPELSKTQRLALRRNKKRVLRDLRKNYRAFEKIEKQLNENAGLVEYLNQNLEKGILNPGTMAAFTELLKRDPEIIKALDIPDTPEDMDFFDRKEVIRKAIKKHDDAAIVVDLDLWDGRVADLGSMGEDSDKIAENLKEQFEDERIDTKNIEVFVDEDTTKEGERVVTVTGPMVEISRLKAAYKIKLSEMHNKSFWEPKKAG